MHPRANLPLLALLALLRFAPALADERLQHLDQLRRSSPGGLIPLSTSAFSSLVEPSPRPFGAFVLLAAPAQTCDICPAMTRQLTTVTREYHALPSARTARNRLFFTVLNLSPADQDFLLRHRIRHVPIFYYLPPGGPATPPGDASPNQYPFQRLGIGANGIRQFVNARAGARLRIVKGNYKIPFVSTVRRYQAAILLVVALLAAAAVYHGLYSSPMFWFGLVVLVYIFSVGGGHYSWIHDVPLVVVNNEGRTEYVAPGSRSQYVAEGFFVSATCVSISVLLILIQELPSVLPNKEVQTLVGGLLFVMTIFAITAMLVMYYLKMPQYLQYNELS